MEGTGLVCASSCCLQEAPPPAQRLAGPCPCPWQTRGPELMAAIIYVVHGGRCQPILSAASAPAGDDWPGDGGLTPVSRGLLSIGPGIFSPPDGLCMSDTSLVFEMIPPDVFQSIMTSVTAVVLGNGPVSVPCLWSPGRSWRTRVTGKALRSESERASKSDFLQCCCDRISVLSWSCHLFGLQVPFL